MIITVSVDRIARDVALAAVRDSRRQGRVKLDEYNFSVPVPDNPDDVAKMQQDLLQAYTDLNDPKVAQDFYDQTYADFINHAKSLPEPERPRPPSPRTFQAPPMVDNPWWRWFNPWDSMTDWDETNRRTTAALEIFQEDSARRTETYKQEITEAYKRAFGLQDATGDRS